jgi:hypothetical protein
MERYEARPEHWADVAEWVEADSPASTDHCIWELRDKVRMLEAELRDLKDTVSMLISSVDRLETDAYWSK